MAERAGEHVDGDRHGLDAEEDRHEVGRLRQDHHAGGGEHEQRVELAELEVVLAHERRRQHRRQRRPAMKMQLKTMLKRSSAMSPWKVV